MKELDLVLTRDRLSITIDQLDNERVIIRVLTPPPPLGA